MGVTWILGIAANLRVLSFLWYPYVVLNSLQGTSPFFIISNFTSVCNLPRVKKLYTTVYAFFFLITLKLRCGVPANAAVCLTASAVIWHQTMTNSLREMCPQRVMVFVFIMLSLIFVAMYTTTKIP